MRTKNIFTPIIAVGLAMSLSVGSEKGNKDRVPDVEIEIGSTPISNINIGYFPDGATSPHILYDQQNNPLGSLKLAFDNNTITNPPSLVYDTSNPKNATLDLGNGEFVGFFDYSGLWVNGFVVDLARSNYSSRKMFSIIFQGDNTAFSGFSDGLIQKKSTFSILNSQNQEDYIHVYFSGAVLSDFIINSQSINSFSFNNCNYSLDEVNGNINIEGNNSKNTFNFNNVTYRGTFTNAISTNTQINLNNSNTQFIGDINTTGGTTTINFLTSGATFQGNITANGGNNIINFSSGDFHFSSTTISATNNSKNILNINGNVNTSDGTLRFEGDGNIDGDNIINIADGSYLNSYFGFTSGLGKINFKGSTGGVFYPIFSGSAASIITFEKDGTFHIPGASMGVYSDKTHTFIIDKTITFDSAFLAGERGASSPGYASGTIFRIDDLGSLRLEYDGVLAGLYTYEASTTQIIFNGASGSFFGDLCPDGSETRILFKQDGTFGFGGTIYANGSYDKTQQRQNDVNIFLIDHNIVFNTQLTASYDEQYGTKKGNVFLISDQKSLSFSNADDSAYLKTIGGNTQIIFEGSRGGLGGNLIAEGGNNEITFENAGTFSFSTANLIANNDSQNIFTIDKDITINSDITLSGNASSSGGNIFNISSGNTLSLKNGSALTTLITNGGNTQVNLEGNNINLEGNIQTENGVTYIGTTFFQYGRTLNLDSTFIANNSGVNYFKNFYNFNTIISEQGLIFDGNATIESGGGNIIDNIVHALSITNSSGEKKPIKTIGGVTYFGYHASVNTQIIADGGDNIFIPQGVDAKLSANSWIANGDSKNIFVANTRYFSLFGSANSDDNVVFGGNNMSGGNLFYVLDDSKVSIYDQNSNKGTIKTIGGLTQVIFSASNGRFSGNFLAEGGNNEITFVENGTFDIYSDFNAVNGTNRFVINHNITLQSASNSITLNSSEQSTNKNIFDIYANSSLSLQNSSFDIQSGNVEINFKGSEGKGLLNTHFSTTNSISAIKTITINIEGQAYGTLNGTMLSNDSTNTLNLQENSTLEVSDDDVFLHTINILGNQANLILSAPYTSRISVLNPILGEKLIINCNEGSYNILRLKSGGNELMALNVLNGTLISLYLEQGSTSILKEINMSKNKGVYFALQSSNTSLTLKNNLVNNGEVDFDFEANGGSINSDIQSNSTGIATFSFNQPSGTYSINGLLSTSGEGKNIFDLTNKSATINNDLAFSGSDIIGEGGNIINIGANQTFTLQSSAGGTPAPRSILTTGGKTYLNLTGDLSTLSGNILTSSGNTIINFSGDSQLSGTLEISDTGNTEIVVKNGKIGTISKQITANGETLNINLGDNSTLALNGNLSTTKGETTISFIGSSGAISGTFITSSGASTAFELGARDSQSVIATINGTLSNANGVGGTNSNYNGGENFFAINAKDTTLINSANGLVFSSGLNIISFENTNGATLHWKGTSGNNEQNITTSGGETEIRFSNSGVIARGINTSGGNTTLYLGGAKSGSKVEGVINGAINSNGGGANNVEFDNSNNTLTLKDNATFSQVSNLNNGNNNGISFYHTSRSSTDFKTLTIGSKDSANGISGSGLHFLVYAKSNESKAKGANQVYADKIIIHSSSNASATTHTLGVRFENQDSLNLDTISYEKGGSNNILIASVSNSSKVSFNTQSTQVLGFDVARIDYVTENTDENGVYQEKGNYTSYFVGKAKTTEVVVAEQEITATAFTLNYDLYMANFNSLNKRMGELRENAHSQGVWARVFNGALSNEFGLGSKSNYTTIQAGYDYAFGFEGANNYLGVALSYALSTSSSDNTFDNNGQQRELGNIYSNAVEVAVYNSYVSDRGWYNDSIAKFSYLMSDFEINNLNDHTSTNNSTKNFALTLSDEVGYRFILGGSKEWSITPQIELGFGYFNQSDFKQTLANSSAYLDSMAEALMTLRARIGSSFGYDFKAFTQESGFNASVYMGVFYEYDYLSGGEIQMSTQRGTESNKYSNLSSDGRVVVNVGTNMSIKDNTRIYFDFEKSFMGKITTDYQVNVGVRYSFGESSGYTPKVERAEFEAPLRIEGEESEKNNKEEKENTEKTQTNTTDTPNPQEQKESPKDT